MKKMKRYFSGIITIVMLVGMVNTNVRADIKDDNEHNITAIEVDETSRLDESTIKPNELIVKPTYENDEIVTVIVEMEDSPVMEYYEVSNYSIGEEASTGEAVSDFLASEEAKAISEEIINNQESIISSISDLVNSDNEIAKLSEDGFEVVNKWSTIVNAIAIKVPYGIIKNINKIDGVKRAYVEHIYDRPTPIDSSVVEDGKGTYSYSLDMAGIEEVWQQGYTGKGMLVAVLDTGLDIKMDWNSEIVRVHEAFTDNSFKSGNPTDGEDDWDLRYSSDSLKAFLAGNQLNSTTGSNGNQITYDKNELYKNLKVPYACDYADGDLNVWPADSDHGTHVTGTIAGFVSTDEGEIKFSGVAPDAQVLSMKVFSDAGGGASESFIINALEDSLKLGADIVNLSLGSDNGYAEDDTVQNDIYERLNKSRIIFMTSAGNSTKSSANNNYGGAALADNPDESMISSPSVYSSNLSVASIDNTIDVQSYFSWYDDENVEHKVYFSDPWGGVLKAQFSDKEYPIYSVGGVGTYNDYYAAGFNNGYNNGKTGLALVKRGEISFADKVKNATYFSGVNSRNERYGVQGVIIYDNDPDSTELIGISVSGTTLPSSFISGKSGEEIVKAIESGYDVKIKVSKSDETIDNSTAGEMSSFTSWGAGPGLELKPEITAPGGNIWSSVVDRINTNNEGYVGSYQMMSGTSMAAPHMSGIGALVRQYSLKKGLLHENSNEIISKLLVSTAIPQKDKNGVYYSPRQQGAGLVNASSAISTPAYITVSGKNIGKLELGDDKNKTGEYSINFNLKNISSEDLKYNVEVVLMRPETLEVTGEIGQRNLISNNDVIIKSVQLGEVNVAANGSTNFNQKVSLTSDEKANLDELFKNGTYIEGYVILTDATEDGNPQIGMPMLAFYGDWTKAPIFDAANWIDEPEDGENVFNNETTWNTSIVGSTQTNPIYGIIGYFNLGQNIFDPGSTMNQKVYKKENITLSPNGDEYFDRIDDYILYQLRDAKLVVIEAKNSESGEVYMREWASYPSKTLYNSSVGAPMPFSVYGTFPSWDGTDKDGNVLPSGTKCTYTITAYSEGEYGEKVYNEEEGRYVTNFDSIIPGENEPKFNNHEMDMTGDIISFPVTIDTVAPKLKNNAVKVYKKDGRTYITGTVCDEDGSIASVEVTPYVIRSYKEGYGDPNYAEVGIDRNNTFYKNDIYDVETKEHTFTVDITEYAHTNESYNGENNYYDFEWNGNVLISCGDYGANDRSYAISANASEGIVLSQTSALLKPGQEFDLSVNNNTESSDAVLTRTSSNPEVATIDEFGHVVAVAQGQTIITVSDGTSSAICVVAVEEVNTKVESFDLSIDKFSGLKYDGQVIVKVTNLKPANVKLDNIRWEVSEDEDYANDYAAGLITVSKYSSDGLSGALYITGSSSETSFPKGHATLTVTLDDVQRTMDIDWEEISKSISKDDDLISGENYNDQVIYVNQGESASVTAKYKQAALHQIGDVQTELKGLKLDGANYFGIGGSYKAKLINEENYALPDAEDVHLYIVYSDEYKYEIKNTPYYTSYTYDSETGEIDVIHAPTGATNKLLIQAEGVESPGAEAGELSNTEYTKPDGMFGPFDWTVTSGNGKLEIEGSDLGENQAESVIYTPSEPGVSYITATTKDKKYSLNFAVISEPILGDKLTLDENKIEMKVGETANPIATLSPTPTLENDAELTWKSFNPSVATVAEDGTITGVSEGYAYIKVESAANNNVISYCIVHVENTINKYTVIFKDYDGTILKEEVVEEGNSATPPANPEREGYTFSGWDTDLNNIKENTVVTAKYSVKDSNSGEPSEEEGTETPGGDNGSGDNGSGDNENPDNPGNEDDVIEVPEFIEDIIVDDVISKGEGNGSIESPLQLEVKDVTLDKFELFLTKLNDLNPVIVDKYVEGNYTIYKIKVKDTSILAKFANLFKEISSDEGYIYLKVANNLDDANKIINKIDETIKLENPIPDEDNGNQGGNEGVETPGEDNGNQGENEGVETPGEDNGNQGENEGVETPDEDNGNQDGDEGTETPDKDNGNQGGDEGTIIPDGDNENQNGNEEIITPDGDKPSDNNGSNNIGNDSNNNEQNTDGNLPITGGTNVIPIAIFAIIIVGVGAYLLFKNKKKKLE